MTCFAAQCGADETVVLARPDSGGEPTKVTVGVYLTDLSDVDSVEQSFTPNFLLMTRWSDPRIASAEAAAAGVARKMPLDDVWNPEMIILNQKWLHKLFNPRDLVTVDPAGNVTYVQQFYGDMVFPMNLKKFPFDGYVLPITIISGHSGPEDVQFVIDSERFGRNDNFSIADWEIGPLNAHAGTYRLKSQGRDLSRIDFELYAKRYSGFYISRIILPLVFIVIMSFTVFWIDPNELGPQLGVATTSILTLIAFQFAVSSSLPRIFYLTQLDLFILGATVIVFGAFLEAVATSFLAKNNRSEMALSIDKRARVLFPLAFILLSAYAFFIY